MLKLINNDMFSVVKRIKNIDANYLVYYNLDKERFELYYQKGFKKQFEIVLSSCLTYLDYKKVCQSRICNIDNILKQVQQDNDKRERKNNALLKDEMVSKTKTLLRVGV